jgi:hypothetical protein
MRKNPNIQHPTLMKLFFRPLLLVFGLCVTCDAAPFDAFFKLTVYNCPGDHTNGLGAVSNHPQHPGKARFAWADSASTNTHEIIITNFGSEVTAFHATNANQFNGLMVFAATYPDECVEHAGTWYVVKFRVYGNFTSGSTFGYTNTLGMGANSGWTYLALRYWPSCSDSPFDSFDMADLGGSGSGPESGPGHSPGGVVNWPPWFDPNKPFIPPGGTNDGSSPFSASVIQVDQNIYVFMDAVTNLSVTNAIMSTNIFTDEFGNGAAVDLLGPTNTVTGGSMFFKFTTTNSP